MAEYRDHPYSLLLENIRDEAEYLQSVDLFIDLFIAEWNLKMYWNVLCRLGWTEPASLAFNAIIRKKPNKTVCSKYSQTLD